jgi:hypothetical protein
MTRLAAHTVLPPRTNVGCTLVTLRQSAFGPSGCQQVGQSTLTVQVCDDPLSVSVAFHSSRCREETQTSVNDHHVLLDQRIETTLRA